MSASRLAFKAGLTGNEKHPFPLEDMRGLVDAVQNPIAVFHSETRAGDFVVLIEKQLAGKNYVVAIDVNRKVGALRVNSIRSIYDKNSSAVLDWIEHDSLAYKNEEKLNEWLSQQRSNSADVRKRYAQLLKRIKDFKNAEDKQIRLSLENNSGYRQREDGTWASAAGSNGRRTRKSTTHCSSLRKLRTFRRRQSDWLDA